MRECLIARLVLAALMIPGPMLISAVHAKPPNIIVILADDLGYGDVGCYNQESRVATPNLDQLAREGVRFTDAHSPSTVCTPSRYGLLTGRMCFRTGYRGGVFDGVGGPSLIEAERLTLPEMLRQAGYATACVGKWHLGLSFYTAEGQPAYAAEVSPPSPLADWRQGGRSLEKVKLVDFGQPITDGPTHRGFDYFFGTACCPTTDWLYAYINQDRVEQAPTHQLDRSHLPQHPYANDLRLGMVAPNFEHEMVDLVFMDKSLAWIRAHHRESPEQPFFLYHAMQAVHLPSLAAPEYQGKTEAGPHGDFIAQLDSMVGMFTAELDRLGISDETLLVFTSDNGPEVTSVVHMRQDHQHDGARPWRGMKRDNWEGGHRVPMLMRWPQKIAPLSESNATVCLTDLMATLADVVGVTLPPEAAEDSVSFFNALLGDAERDQQRAYVLHETIRRDLAIRSGPWKYLDHPGSGGNDYRQARLVPYALPEKQPDAPGQLYNLERDPGETNNLYFEYPEVVQQLKGWLQKSRETGRTQIGSPVRL
ncbi:MAG: sulfatase-like hydrolase/transferase [bacterium]|nr:sulfatase-like hydrolase/transferase [bacterium]